MSRVQRHWMQPAAPISRATFPNEQRGVSGAGGGDQTGLPQPVYGRDDEHDMTFAGFLLFFDPPKATYGKRSPTWPNWG